jgi:hypothetical protein
VPAGSTVQKAFLYGTYYFNAAPSVADRTIDFDGTVVETVQISGPVSGCCELSTTRADVTAQVAAKVGGGGGITSFAVNTDPDLLDGVALVVVYSNAAQPENTIAILDGSASTTGDTATFVLASPLDKSVPGFQATMALGSGFSYQGIDGHVCGGGQFSLVDVNSQRLTSCAGNYDDGVGNNGGLITVGGVGDSIDNPADPNTQTGADDELYNLDPFLAQGATSIEIKSSNPSDNDTVPVGDLHLRAGDGHERGLRRRDGQRRRRPRRRRRSGLRATASDGQHVRRGPRRRPADDQPRLPLGVLQREVRDRRAEALGPGVLQRQEEQGQVHLDLDRHTRDLGEPGDPDRERDRERRSGDVHDRGHGQA